MLNETQKMIRDMARQFAQERLLPGVVQRDRTGEFPRAELKEMGQLGLMGMVVPEAWGGADAGYVAMALAIAEVAAGDAGCSTIMSVQNSLVCSAILRFGSDEQKERFLLPCAKGEMIGAFALTEPQAGSDAAALRTTACREGDEYVLNGTKQFITSGKHGDVALVFAVTDASAGKRGMSAFLVPTNTPGYVVTAVEHKMGQHSTDTAQITFDGMRIPIGNRMGEEGEGYKIALANLEAGRIGIAAQSLGLAQAAYDAAIAYAKERQSFGKPIMEHQAVGFRLAEMATRIEAARLLVLQAARLRDEGKPCLKEACMAKLFASEAAESVARDAIQTLGGYGYIAEYHVERIYRDARVCSIYEGTSDIQKLIIARELAKESA
ncbi:acyl-CoA dehydrogenase [bacterium]|nr:acyl-CoA dehydrogenase [bacterium]